MHNFIYIYSYIAIYIIYNNHVVYFMNSLKFVLARIEKIATVQQRICGANYSYLCQEFIIENSLLL